MSTMPTTPTKLKEEKEEPGPSNIVEMPFFVNLVGNIYEYRCRNCDVNPNEIKIWDGCTYLPGTHKEGPVVFPLPIFYL